MKKIKDTLNSLGVMLTTGAMSIIGFFLGLIAFKPECISFGKDTDNKNKESE